VESPLLALDDLVVGYPGRPLSSPLALKIPTGARVGIIGSNGSGKSTLIKTLLGLVKVLGGSFQWQEKLVFGYVPQEDPVNPIFPITVHDLLKMGAMKKLTRLRFSSPDFETLAIKILGDMSILDLKDRLVRELSRGQRQRALIARALMAQPSVLILDEPYNALDFSFKEKLRQMFAQWQDNFNVSIFIIEHDLNRIINLIDWVILLGPGGTLCGPVTQVLTEESLSRTYGTKLHFHEENGEKQIHFL